MQIKTDGRDGKQMGSFPIYLDEKSRDDEYNAVHASIVGRFRSSWIHGDVVVCTHGLIRLPCAYASAIQVLAS